MSTFKSFLSNITKNTVDQLFQTHREQEEKEPVPIAQKYYRILEDFKYKTNDYYDYKDTLYENMKNNKRYIIKIGQGKSSWKSKHIEDDTIDMDKDFETIEKRQSLLINSLGPYSNTRSRKRSRFTAFHDESNTSSTGKVFGPSTSVYRGPLFSGPSLLEKMAGKTRREIADERYLQYREIEHNGQY